MSDLQPLWDECLKLSLLGTQRQTAVPSFKDIPPPVSQLLDDLYPGGKLQAPEARGAALLQLSGALSAYQIAGRQSPPLDAVAIESLKSIGDSSPAADITLPVSLLSTLQRIIHNAHLEALLPEWLALANKAGIAAPPETLPDLLDAGTKRDDLKSVLSMLLGTRGRWLAQFEPQWQGLMQQLDITASTQLPDLSVWEEGSMAVRVEYLKQLRAQDAGKGRELLHSVWKAENANTRSNLLIALAEGLSTDDEAFLEQALGDRAKSVRATASQFLAELPDSAHLQRLKALADSWLALVVDSKRSLLGKKRDASYYQASLPEQWSDDWRRDALEEQSPNRELGQKAGWLYQALSAIPVEHWSARWQQTPEILIAASQSSEWGKAILLGWETSVQRFGCSPEWADALLKYREYDAAHAAWDSLGDEQYQQLCLDRLKQNLDRSRFWQQLDILGQMDVSRLQGTFWETLFNAVQQQFKRSKPPGNYLAVMPMKYVLNLLAVHLPNELSQCYEALLIQCVEGMVWSDAVQDALELVQLRHATQQQFADCMRKNNQ